MNDTEFGELTKKVASMFPHTNADAEIARLKKRIAASDKPDPDNKHAIIENNVWGWRILWPEVGFAGLVLFGGRYKGGFSILSEGLATLDDAVRVCDAFKMPYKVSDIQETDPL